MLSAIARAFPLALSAFPTFLSVALSLFATSLSFAAALSPHDAFQLWSIVLKLILLLPFSTCYEFYVSSIVLCKLND
jgi:hypothetical protein